MFENLYFYNNTADIKGGAIYWDELEPIMKNISYKNNSAGKYGDNIACFSQELGIINKTVYENNLHK